MYKLAVSILESRIAELEKNVKEAEEKGGKGKASPDLEEWEKEISELRDLVLLDMVAKVQPFTSTKTSFISHKYYVYVALLIGILRSNINYYLYKFSWFLFYLMFDIFGRNTFFAGTNFHEFVFLQMFEVQFFVFGQLSFPKFAKISTPKDFTSLRFSRVNFHKWIYFASTIL